MVVTTRMTWRPTKVINKHTLISAELTCAVELCVAFCYCLLLLQLHSDNRYIYIYIYMKNDCFMSVVVTMLGV